MNFEPELTKAAPGIVGSLLAMLRLSGINLWQRLTAFFGGVACSHWGTEAVVQLWPVMNERLSAFVLGLFGMAIIHKAFETLDNLKPLEFIRDLWPGGKKP